MATQKTKQKILASFLDLVGTRGWTGFGMSDLATEAGVRLSVLRAEFPGKTACLRAFLSEIDQQVLDGIDAEMADQPPRERLFDVLMARLDALAPHKPALRAMKRAALADPTLALKINREAVTSARWMLTAAGIPVSGPRAAVMAQGLALAFARVVDVWLDDEDPGLARTMSALDRQLEEGETWMGRLDSVGRFLRPFLSGLRRGRRDRQRAGEGAATDDGGPVDGASPSAA